MNVLYVSIDDLSKNYAWKTHIAGIVNSCAKGGIRFDLVAFNASCEDFPLCRTHSIVKDSSSVARKLGSYLRLAFTVLLVACQNHYAAIYVRGVTPLLFIPLFRFFCGSKTVVEVNGFLDTSRGWKNLSIASLLEVLTFRTAHAVVTVSETFRKGLGKLYGVRRSKIFVIPNGADIKLFSPGQNPTVPTALFVGSFYPHHAIETMLDAVSGHVSAGKLRLILVGSSSEGGKTDLRMKENSGIEFKGELPQPEVARIMRNCTFGLFCRKKAYKFDGPSAVKLYEYMACGKPVIVLTNVPEIYNFISENKVGLVDWMHEDGNDAARLRALVDRAISEDIGELGRNGRKLCEAYYNWERAGSETRRMLANLV